jgi:hypothetical protein
MVRIGSEGGLEERGKTTYLLSPLGLSRDLNSDTDGVDEETVEREGSQYKSGQEGE